MKKIILTCLAVMLLNPIMAQTTELTNVITTRGYAEREVTPNRIEVAVMLTEAASKGRMTLEELEQLFMKSLHYAKINAKTNVKIVSQSSEAHRKTDAFQYKSFVITVTSAEELNALFAGFDKYYVQDARVTKVWNTHYKKITNELLALAVQDAKERATIAALAINQNVGRAVIIDEGYNSRNVMNSNVRIRGAAGIDDSNSAIPLVNAMKNITVSQSITVKFELK